jgi:hypothetical protein
MNLTALIYVFFVIIHGYIQCALATITEPALQVPPRFDDMGSNTACRGNEKFNLTTATTLSECQQKCINTYDCTGIEFETNGTKCELWYGPIQHVDIISGYNCQRFIPGFYDMGSNTACIGHEKFYLTTATTLSECQQKCINTYDCKGIEFQTTSTRCELWYGPIQNVDSVSGYNCQQFTRMNDNPLPTRKDVSQYVFDDGESISDFIFGYTGPNKHINIPLLSNIFMNMFNGSKEIFYNFTMDDKNVGLDSIFMKTLFKPFYISINYYNGNVLLRSTNQVDHLFKIKLTHPYVTRELFFDQLQSVSIQIPMPHLFIPGNVSLELYSTSSNSQNPSIRFFKHSFFHSWNRTNSITQHENSNIFAYVFITGFSILCLSKILNTASQVRINQYLRYQPLSILFFCCFC